MRPKIVNGILLVGMAILVGVACAAGYWYVQTHGAVDASVIVPPADSAGDTSATGAAHGDHATEQFAADEPESEVYVEVRRAVDGMSAGDARAYLASRLESRKLSGEERAHSEASLGLALLDVGDAEAARSAFARAFKACADADGRVRLAHSYAQLLYQRGHFAATLELLNAGRFVGAQFSAERLALEALRGLTLEELGREPEAQDAYERALESALASELDGSPRGRDAARVIGLRLARRYREAGRDEDAVAISRMLRAWLGEEDLVLR